MDKLPPGNRKRMLRAAAHGELAQPSTQSKPRRRSLLGDGDVLGLAEPDDHLSTTPASPALAPTPAARCLGRLGCRTVAVCYLHADGGCRVMCSSTFPEVVGYLPSPSPRAERLVLHNPLTEACCRPSDRPQHATP